MKTRVSRLAHGLLHRGRLPYVEYLQRAAGHPAIRALRLRAREHLIPEPGQRVLDIGCGPGTLTVELARLVGDRGQIIGIDRDRLMVAEANARAADAGVSAWTVHRLADCTALPFEGNVFDACYCERVLQHLQDPEPSMAVREALRVLKPGGRVVFVDTDWTTMAFASDEPLLARIAAAYPLQFRNPRSGYRLQEQLLSAGAGNVTVEQFRVSIDPEAAPWLMAATEETARLQAKELVRWRAGLARSRSTGVPCGHVTLMLVAAIKTRA